MPTLLLINGFRFYFFSNENNEPPHIHVNKAEANAKFWLIQEIDEAYSYGFSNKDRRFISQTILENQESFLNAWSNYFKDDI